MLRPVLTGVLKRPPVDPTPRSRGQSVAELALILPVLLLLVLIALDFGRLFLGWIALNNMARVGADFAATHPTTDWDSDTDPDVVAYRDLIASNADAINCLLRTAAPPGPADPPPNPVYGASREVGDQVRVDLTCYFEIVTPIVSTITGGWAKMSASSSFPITYGCLADCPTGPPATPPPAADNCRDIPDLRDLSVAGARLAWEAAGFSVAMFEPLTGDDTRTVVGQTVTEPPGSETCPAGEAYVLASVAVTLRDLVAPPPTPTCVYVPDLRGMLVGGAREAWLASGLEGSFTPASDHDDQIVIEQVTTPGSDPGECLEAPVDVAVAYGPPPPPPPPAPCQVPNFANTPDGDALGRWITAGFTGDLTFLQPKRLPYIIQSQSLVGDTWVACTSDIEVGPNPGNPGGLP